MTNKKKKPRVLLFGDRVNDTYLLPKKPRGGKHQFEAGSDMRFDWENHPRWFRYRKLGGVLMSQELLSKWYNDDIEVATSCPYGANNKPSLVGLESLAEVGHCDADGQETLPTKFEEVGPYFPAQTDKRLALRVKRPIGYSGEEPVSVNFRKVDGFDHPEAIIINDAGGELRFSPSDPDNFFCKLMDQVATGGLSCDVIMKMHLPFREKLAWQKFSAATKAKSRHLVIHAEDLRADRIYLSRCPSWDRCVEDILAALQRGERKIWDLVEATDTLIILFDVEGALVMRRTKARNEVDLNLIYDPESSEGETAKTLPGDIVGKMNAFIVTYTHSLLCDTDADRVVRGLEASRRFGEGTYSACIDELEYPNVPADLKADPPKRKSPNYQSTSISYAPAPDHKTVSLLSAKIAELAGKTETDLAHDIVLNGVETTLRSLPHGQFGKLWTVDREEIEAMRDIDQLVRAYIGDLGRSKPMSLAVFGPPGAGKSFGVKQLIDKDKTPICEFNLSQADARQLPAFFHEIRDLNLQGKTPLCFFDEFDSQNRSLIKFFFGTYAGRRIFGWRSDATGRTRYICLCWRHSGHNGSICQTCLASTAARRRQFQQRVRFERTNQSSARA